MSTVSDELNPGSLSFVQAVSNGGLSWKAKLALAAGVALPLGLTLAANPAAADADPAPTSSDQARDSQRVPTGDRHEDIRDTSPDQSVEGNFGVGGYELVDPIFRASDRAAEISELQDVVPGSTLSPPGDDFFGPRDGLDSTTGLDWAMIGWSVSSRGNRPDHTMYRRKDFGDFSITVLDSHQPDPAAPNDSHVRRSDYTKSWSSSPDESDRRNFSEKHIIDREKFEVLGGSAGLYLNQFRGTHTIVGNDKKLVEKVKLGTFEPDLDLRSW